MRPIQATQVRVAALSDDSPTGRSKAKEVARLARSGDLPVEVVGMVVTDSFETWKVRANKLQEAVDAFVVLNHNTFTDRDGAPVHPLEVGVWYLTSIPKPDVAQEERSVEAGIPCAIDDSGSSADRTRRR